jgi:hypothetical protein
MRSRTGLLACLESLPWPRPGSVQVLIHDEEDDCFGLWMIHDGKLEEVALPRTQRYHDPAPETREYAPHPGYLWRTDQGQTLPEQTPVEHRDERPAW